MDPKYRSFHLIFPSVTFWTNGFCLAHSRKINSNKLQITSRAVYPDSNAFARPIVNDDISPIMRLIISHLSVNIKYG